MSISATCLIITTIMTVILAVSTLLTAKSALSDFSKGFSEKNYKPGSAVEKLTGQAGAYVMLGGMTTLSGLATLGCFIWFVIEQVQNTP